MKPSSRVGEKFDKSLFAPVFVLRVRFPFVIADFGRSHIQSLPSLGQRFRKPGRKRCYLLIRVFAKSIDAIFAEIVLRAHISVFFPIFVNTLLTIVRYRSNPIIIAFKIVRILVFSQSLNSLMRSKITHGACPKQQKLRNAQGQIEEIIQNCLNEFVRSEWNRNDIDPS